MRPSASSTSRAFVSGHPGQKWGKRLRGGVEHSIGVERVNDADAISEPDQNRLGISLGEVEQ